MKILKITVILLLLFLQSLLWAANDSVFQFHQKNIVGERFAFEIEGTMYENIKLQMPHQLKRGRHDYNQEYEAKISGTMRVDSVNEIGNPVILSLSIESFRAWRNKTEIPMIDSFTLVHANLCENTPIFKMNQTLLPNAEHAFLSFLFPSPGKVSMNDYFGLDRPLQNNLTWIPDNHTLFQRIAKEKISFKPESYTSKVSVIERINASIPFWLIHYQMLPKSDSMVECLTCDIQFLVPKNPKATDERRTLVKSSLVTRSQNLPSGELLPPEAVLIQSSERVTLKSLRKLP